MEIFLQALLLSIGLMVLGIVDWTLYNKSPYPERIKYGNKAGSGFVAFWNLVIRKKRK